MSYPQPSRFFVELSKKYDIFSPRIDKKNIAESSHYEIHHPINALDRHNNAPINFLIRGTEDYINFEGTRVLLKGKFVGKIPQHKLPAPASGGTETQVAEALATSPGTKFGPINLFGHTIFKSVDISLNGTSITMADQNYAYRAYIQTLFNNTPDSLAKTQTLAGWGKDTPGKMDSTDPAVNGGMRVRRDRANTEGEVTLEFQVAHPLFQMVELFPSKIDINVTFHKNENKNFYMMYNDAVPGTSFDFEITSLVFIFHKIKVTKEYALAVEQILNEGVPIEYIWADSKIDVHQLPTNVPYLHRDHITYGHLPRRLLLGFVATDAYNGTPKKNPFNFHHFGARKIALYKNGLEFPRPPFQLDMAKKGYTDLFYHMLQTFHAINSPFTMDINETDLENGYFFPAWEFSGDQMGGDIPMSMLNQGTNIHLTVEFGANLDAAVSMIVYYELDMRVAVNKFYQITVENH